MGTKTNIGWNGRVIDPDTSEVSMARVGKALAGNRMMDGLKYEEMPQWKK